ncbi:hypothetical protein ACFQ1S_03170 [Kibdelosporangium lantanae]|uniref:Transketolase-like pyrimidine-binding domain-containing protein n=1 Tax=Kibdelosporangium lantanae TaxID=1497396 RepID=A0ABW3M404_9PSEU
MAAPVIDPKVKAATPSTKLTMGKAINMGLRAAMERDSKVIVMGEDVGKMGGVYRITDGLQKDFGEQRVLDTPLAESGIIGTAVGLAVRGFRPVCEIQFEGFIFPGFDQINSQVAKLHYRTQGMLKVPMVIRVPFGGGVGAVEHHSESPESLFAHLPGIRVVSCSNPVDAYWMIQQAIDCDDPVLFFEPKRRYLLSWGANLYSRIWLGAKVKDMTAGYRAFRRAALEKLKLHNVASAGYCFQIDMTWRVVEAGFTVVESPITFTEREIGQSKMSGSIVREALVRVFKWGLRLRYNQVRALVTGKK